jgi:hypothetical protein
MNSAEFQHNSVRLQSSQSWSLQSTLAIKKVEVVGEASQNAVYAVQEQFFIFCRKAENET